MKANPIFNKCWCCLRINDKQGQQKADTHALGIKICQLILGLQLCVGTIVKAQVKAQGLQVGEMVPDVTISNMVNYPTQTAKISDFKGKLLILDFWATWCSPCVAMIPRLDSLQKLFEGQVQFLPITYQKKEEVLAFKKKLQNRFPSINLNFPESVQNSQFNQLFPHNTLPHYVWIGGDGRVNAITSFEEITAQKIDLALRGNYQMPSKEDPVRIPYSPDVPLFINGNGGNGAALTYLRAFSGYVPGIGSGIRLHKDSITGTVITGRNKSIKGLYRIAFSNEKGIFPNNRIVVEVKDPAKMSSSEIGSDYLNWMASGNAYCYELRVPAGKDQEAWAMMRQDLALFFPQYSVGLEVRNVPSLVLTRTSKKDKLKTKGDSAALYFDAFGCKLTNTYLDHLLVRLKGFYLQLDPRPFINETGYTGRIDMELNCSLSDVEALNRQLANYDLELKEALRPVELLVIKDRGNSVF